MIRGLYIAASGLTANERLQDVVSNNIANADTVGYKGDNGVLRSFPEELLYRINDNAGGPGANTPGPIGSISNGVLLQEVLPTFVQGALVKSDNPNAQAIIDNPATAALPNERSYFAVYDPRAQQKMYTRSGDFNVDPSTNFLSTSTGDYVLPVDKKTGLAAANMRVLVDPKTGQHEIADATGKTVDATGKPYSNLYQEGIVDINDSTKLDKYGDTNFTLGQGGKEVPGTGQVQKGQLEQSNVDLSSQMVSMTNVMRSYEANQQMIKTLDNSLGKAVTIGQIG